MLQRDRSGFNSTPKEAPKSTTTVLRRSPRLALLNKKINGGGGSRRRLDLGGDGSCIMDLTIEEPPNTEHASEVHQTPLNNDDEEWWREAATQATDVEMSQGNRGATQASAVVDESWHLPTTHLSASGSARYSSSDGDEPDPVDPEEEYHSGNSSDEDELNQQGFFVDSDDDEVHVDIDGDGSEYDGQEAPTEFSDFVVQADDLYEDFDDVQAGNPKLKVGMEFATGAEFKKHLKTYAIINKFVYVPIKAESVRYRAKCRKHEQGCPWLIYASKLPDQPTFRLKSLYDVHTCGARTEFVNPLADGKWVADVMEEKIRLHELTYIPAEIVKSIWSTYQVNISYHVGWLARCIVMERINGSYKKSYEMVPQLCIQLLKSNPRSIATFSRAHVDKTFRHMCIAYKASIDGFLRGCRPIIGLDGCFLKGKFGGVLLAATGLDAKNGLFPLGIYICSSEDYPNWFNFLTELHPHLVQHELRLTFISDRQKGLIKAVKEVFPPANHRFCFRHMYKNFKAKFKGKLLESEVWNAAKAYKLTDFNKHMEEVQKLDKEAHDWLLKEDVKSWARSHFDHTSHCEHITNNFSESFNSWILKLRDKPILKMGEKFHSMMMTLFYKRRQEASQWDENGLVPTAQRQLDRMINNMHLFIVRGSDNNTWEVENSDNAKWIVNLREKKCSCIQWQLRGFPCTHAVTVLAPYNPNWLEYCSDHYSVKAYRRSYAGAVLPLADKSDWEPAHSEVKAPIFDRQPGRPKMQRRRGEDEPNPEPKKKRRCKNCGSLGHNSRTCKGPGTSGNRRRVRTRGGLSQNSTNERGSTGGEASSTSGIGRGHHMDGSRGGSSNRSGCRGGRSSNRSGATLQQSMFQTMSGGRFHQTFHQSFNIGDVQPTEENQHHFQQRHQESQQQQHQESQQQQQHPDQPGCGFMGGGFGLFQ